MLNRYKSNEKEEKINEKRGLTIGTLNKQQVQSRQQRRGGGKELTRKLLNVTIHDREKKRTRR